MPNLILVVPDLVSEIWYQINPRDLVLDLVPDLVADLELDLQSDRVHHLVPQGNRSGTRSGTKSAARKVARPGAIFSTYTVPDGTWCSRSL